MASLITMVDQLAGMQDTNDLTEWENDFVKSIVDRCLASKRDTRNFSSKQVEVIERIWSKHFAG